MSGKSGELSVIINLKLVGETFKTKSFDLKHTILAQIMHFGKWTINLCLPGYKDVHVRADV